MEENSTISKYCSSKEHHNEIAISFCQKCEIYMCSKCDSIHNNLCPNHQKYDINLKNSFFSNNFTGFCPIKKHHQIQLEYFCKTHNELCCAKCIAKIKSKGNGQHTDCDVCNYEDIINEKKQNLKNNIKILEDLSNSLQSSIDELKIIVEKISKNKEEIKLNIQKIFTKIRNALNNREDELLLDIDKKYDEFYYKEESIKEIEKLPKKIEISLEKGKVIDKEWDNDNKLNIIINDCINIENNINEINQINNNIKRFNDNKIKIKFYHIEENMTESIKKFGYISNDDFLFNIYIISNNEDYIKYLKS